ncbi:type III-B CRISPR module RAMP protein Cmr1 [uncultured Thiothrix sp.]|uniref:type III-B CRISPR module RAMP protein Cmr1 n=1 Tax=uncultured Thiothrix sp. TaxID=223185 RepID=UPI002633B4BE|nr:type III-B CRISPR module RAMP protein Cmr1 [uncultured Thiothrix sp.]
MIQTQLKSPHIIEATYRIVTPMFIGDAEQQATGISPQSVKGTLRFWWRALNWGRIRSQEKTDEAALKILHEQEAKLFGIAMDEKRSSLNERLIRQKKKDELVANGQGKFTLQIQQPKNLTPVKVKDLTTAGLKYLLGIGLSRDQEHTALSTDQSFILKLIIRDASQDEKNNLCDTLLVFGLLGGLGSRARKGFGSVTIESLSNGKEAVAIPQNIAELKNMISRWKCNVGLPMFTAFSSQTRIDITAQGTKPLELLNIVGEEQQLYRSYGQNGFVNGKRAERKFASDHDLVLDVIRTKTTHHSIPMRSVFGLPHNYFFSSEFKKIKDEALARGMSEPDAKKEARRKSQAEFSASEKNRTRRASPLFIHVHQFPDKKVAVIQSLLPSEFLPDRTALEFKMSNSPKDKVQVTFNEQAMIDWQVIHTYMDRFTDRVHVL